MSSGARTDAHATLVQSWEQAAAMTGKREDHQARTQGDICFAAHGACGEVALILPRVAACGHEGVLGAAFALEQPEPIVQLLETWLAAPLDFAPGRGALQAADCVGASFDLPQAEPQQSGDTRIEGRLWLPVQLVRQLAAPSVALTEYLRWHHLQCNVQICDQQLRNEQIAGLEMGGAVLIPASFGSHWVAQLESLAIPALTRPVHIDLAGNSIVLSSDARKSRSAHLYASGQVPAKPDASARPEARLTISLIEALPVRADVLLGWSDDVTVLPLDDSQALQARVEAGGRTLATGEIIPAGLGYACWITGMAAAARPAGQSAAQSESASAAV
jgi:hypothetical protein